MKYLPYLPDSYMVPDGSSQIYASSFADVAPRSLLGVCLLWDGLLGCGEQCCHGNLPLACHDPPQSLTRTSWHPAGI